MGSRCDYRAVARGIASTPRQVRVVNELLSGRPVPEVREDGVTRIGVAGLQVGYWEDLRLRLQREGFTIVSTERLVGTRYRLFHTMKFPGEV